MRRPFLAIAGAAVIAACGGPATDAPPAAGGGARALAAPTELTATLRESIHIDLRWKDNAADEAGYFVEGYYVGHAPSSSEFTVIEVLPPDSTRFSHEKLLPETRFIYRVRPFFGRASNVAEVKTGAKGAPQMQAPPASPAPSTVQASLRSAETEAMAAPADLTATLFPPAGIRLQWKDHARDEDQYLVEVASAGAPFRVAAFEPADTRLWTSYDFDANTQFAFRVRAFLYGEPSNVVEIKTGPDASMGAGAWKRVE